MIAIPQWAVEGGGWGLVLILIGAFLFARSRGILVHGSELDRLERRMEKDTDRVLALYKQQADLAATANIRKDEVIAKQVDQIEQLMAHSAVSAHALSEIMGEARRRGLVP